MQQDEDQVGEASCREHNELEATEISLSPETETIKPRKVDARVSIHSSSMKYRINECAAR